MSEPFIGQVMLFAGNFAPRGWAFCNGQLLSIAQNTALFSILGVTYGGNGQTTFALPDLRGRVAIHPGQGPGLSAYTLGEAAGTENVTLITNQMPMHNHMVACSSETANLPSPQGNFLGTESQGATQVYVGGTPNEFLNQAAITPAGGSQPHTNVQPFLCVNYIIALEGIFPSRN